jgi:hypothetical protein
MGYYKEIYFSEEEKDFIVPLLESKIELLKKENRSEWVQLPYVSAFLEIKYNETSFYQPNRRRVICECVRNFIKDKENEDGYEIKYYRVLGLSILNKCEKCPGSYNMFSQY